MWIKRQKIPMSQFKGHFVLGDLRKFLSVMPHVPVEHLRYLVDGRLICVGRSRPIYFSD